MTDGTPGWFRDPTDPSLARWHDGERWTEHTLVIADQTPGVEPEPPDLGDEATAAVPVVDEPEFHIPRPARGLGRAGGGSWPTWAKVGAPVAVLVLALGAWMLTSGGDDDPGGETATVDTIPASLDEAVEAARRAGLPDEVSDAQAAALIQRICGATTRPAAVDQLGEDLGQIPATSVSALRQSVGALGIGADLRCSEDLDSAPGLIDDLQDLAVDAFSSTTTAPTVVGADAGTDAGTDAGAATDGGDDDGTDGRTTRTTRRGTTSPTTRAPTTTTTRPLPQVLPNTACSSEGAKAQNKITGGSLTCMKKCNSSGLSWRSGTCPTTPTAPPNTGPPPTFPNPTTGGTDGGGTQGSTGGQTDG